MDRSKTKTHPESEMDDWHAVPEMVPTIVELKGLLPKHCFQTSLATSFYYVFKDMFIISGLYWLVLYIDTLPTPARWILYPCYWYLQGTMMWAVFVLGHDAGHGSFSKWSFINNLVGNILHSFILVPYYPWKVSHQHHHKNTGNIDKDEIFYPVRESVGKEGGKSRHFLPFFGLGFAWFFYLLKGYAPRNAYHLNPFDTLFVKHAFQCLVSIVCCWAWLCILLTYYSAKGYTFTDLLIHYAMPIFVFASWLVVTTFLHHQDEGVPWYADAQWDYVRGQLSSVDRDYGWAHHLVHHIGTHQIHHLFTKIPHYHLEEATAVFRQHYPKLVRTSNEPILPAFFKMFFIFDAQQWISDNKVVHVFKKTIKGN